jgi:nitrogen regulatory protein PII
MAIEEHDNLVFLTVIAARKQKDAILEAMLEAGIRLINTSYAKGTVDARKLMKSFGLVPEINKVMITCVSTSHRVDGFLGELHTRFDFGKPNTGIAYTIPVERLCF